MVKLGRGKFRRALSKKRRSRAVAAVGRYRKRARVTKFKSNVPLGLGFPRKMTMTHKYEEVFNLTSTTAALATYRFCANGMYDPNTSGTGHQPMFFDQMAALYNHYCVIGSKIRITVINQTSSGVAGTVGVINNDDTATSYSDITAFSEQSAGKCRLIPGGSTTTTYLGNKFSAKKVYGGSILGNNNLAGSGTTNPGETHFWDIGYQTVSGTNAITIKVDISYIAVWSELKDIGQS